MFYRKFLNLIYLALNWLGILHMVYLRLGHMLEILWFGHVLSVSLIQSEIDLTIFDRRNHSFWLLLFFGLMLVKFSKISLSIERDQRLMFFSRFFQKSASHLAFILKSVLYHKKFRVKRLMHSTSIHSNRALVITFHKITSIHIRIHGLSFTGKIIMNMSIDPHVIICVLFFLGYFFERIFFGLLFFQSGLEQFFYFNIFYALNELIGEFGG